MEPQSAAASSIRELQLSFRSRRLRGCVVAVSGGIDSAVCLAVAAGAFARGRVLALALPDRHSSGRSSELAHQLAHNLGVEFEQYDVTGALDALHCYDLQAAAIRDVAPRFHDGLPFSVELSEDFSDPESLPEFRVAIAFEQGIERFPLTPDAYLRLIAATNLKQRVRMTVTHLRAEERGYGVVGTSNRQEIEQGFFVRYGDGAGDHFPLRNLLKSQVYQLAEAFPEIPREIVERTPTTDTFSLEQSQETFFFGLPLTLNDALWDAFTRGADVDAVAADAGLDPATVAKVFAAFRRRRALAERLTAPGI